MSLEAVEHYFEPYHLTDRIHVFHESTATVAEAAATLGIEPDQIAKTLAFDVDGENVGWLLAGCHASLTANSSAHSANVRT